MQMVDFEYDGERLSDYGLTICWDGSGSDEVQDLGNSITINRVKGSNSYEYISTGASYDDVFKTEFQVIKDGCSVVDEIISDIELNRIMRWLNRKKCCIFRPIYGDDNFMDIYYKGTFNIKAIKIGENVVGLNFTFNTNAPYGFMEPTTYVCEFKNTSDRLIINDISDEIGYIYADVEIKLLQSGNLKITNTLDPDNTVIINNCVSGEIIKLQGKQKIITSSLASHLRLCNDFNYNFIRINNTYRDVMNVFNASLKCVLTIRYSPIRKVGLIL